MAITLDATSRTDLGRGASRRLRREFKTPAIIIGEGKDALSITLDEKKVINASNKSAALAFTCAIIIDNYFRASTFGT